MDAEVLKQLDKKLDRINEKLTNLLSRERKETWLKGRQIMEITIWNDREKLRQAKDNGYIRQRKGKNGIFYLLESVPDVFLKQKVA